jgi:hypothetical protein
LENSSNFSNRRMPVEHKQIVVEYGCNRQQHTANYSYGVHNSTTTKAKRGPLTTRVNPRRPERKLLIWPRHQKVKTLVVVVLVGVAGATSLVVLGIVVVPCATGGADLG